MSIGVIIPYRMRASRLPGKPLLDVAGKPALQRVLERARRSRYAQSLVIATTEEPDDDALSEWGRGHGVEVFRGSTDDVLGRLATAAAAYAFDIVVEVDGDDLLCSPEYMDRGVDLIQANDADYVGFTGLPIGLSPSILRGAALTRAVQLKTGRDTSTGFFRFLQESGQFRVLKPAASDPAHRHLTARLTLDYPQDLEFFRAVYRELDRFEAGWGLADLIQFLHARPDLVALNQGLDKLYWSHFDAGVEKGKASA